MHELLEEMMEVAGLAIPEFVCDDADLECRRHAKKSLCIRDAALNDELMHRHSELLLEGALNCLEFHRQFGDNGMEPELYVPVMLVDEVLHRPRWIQQQHLVKLVIGARSPYANLGDRFAFSSIELSGGGGSQDSVLRTAVGQWGKHRYKRPLPIVPEPECRPFGHGVHEFAVLRARLVPHMPWKQARVARTIFSGSDGEFTTQQSHIIGAGVGCATVTRNKCSSHDHSSFLAAAPNTTPSSQRARGPGPESNVFVQLPKETTPQCVMSTNRKSCVAYTKRLHCSQFDVWAADVMHCSAEKIGQWS
jgi:hypothetical protein